MPVVHVLAHLSAAVLVLSGIAKVRQPTALVQPLRTLRLPATRRAARAIGVRRRWPWGSPPSSPRTPP